MNKLIKNVLNKIESRGFEAYVIGGYIRDMLVGLNSFDIDICTNATPKELITIFKNASIKNIGGISFKIKEYHFEITTYREELTYKNRKPVEFNYINNLVLDIPRRDFTINTICMNSKGEIIDLLNGTEDLTKCLVRLIGDKDTKIKEDPLRSLRAIRIATNLNFTLEKETYKAIQNNNKEILKLSSNRIKEELDKILLSTNVKKGLSLLNDLGFLKLLKITYTEIIPVKNIEAMYAQININFPLPYTKVEKENIDALTKIIKTGEITRFTLYQYGLYLTTVAGSILQVDKKKINKMYKDMPIHEKKDINIRPKEIVSILNIDYSKTISIIIEDLETKIINGTIKNKHSELIKYIKDNRNRWV